MIALSFIHLLFRQLLSAHSTSLKGTTDSHPRPVDQHEIDFYELCSPRYVDIPAQPLTSTHATVQTQNSSHRCRRNTTFTYNEDYTTSKCLGVQVPVADDLAPRPGTCIPLQSSAGWGNAESMLYLGSGCHVPNCIPNAHTTLITYVQKMPGFVITAASPSSTSFIVVPQFRIKWVSGRKSHAAFGLQ